MKFSLIVTAKMNDVEGIGHNLLALLAKVVGRYRPAWSRRCRTSPISVYSFQDGTRRPGA